MKLVEFKPLEHTDGKVVGYLHDKIAEMSGHRKKYPTVVLCPGGAYCFVSQRESDSAALEYLAAGYQVFILHYSVGAAAKGFISLMELSATVMKIRDNEENWNCDGEKIAVCGFSAGGHLAASLGVLWNHPELTKRFDTKSGRNRPAGVVLGYPVITAGEFAHEESIATVSGSEKGTPEYEFFSLENRVTAECAPMFIWHTGEDECVPVENTIAMISALRKNKIPFECHIFPDGDHGMSVCTEEVGADDPYNRQWVQLSKNWLSKLFNYHL
ncbi:MAG: alpha/beta hydrolase [Oscillospiraceae bacterium]